MAAKRISLPPDLFDAAPEPTEASPLETFLKRTRDPMGRLIPQKRKPKTIAAATYGRTIIETQGMIETRNWAGCAIRHLVALYGLMHLKVYGVEAIMSSTERYTATLRMGSFVKQHFDGDIGPSLDYFRWVWSREMGRETWRRENGRTESSRLGFYFVLGNVCMTDYRLALARRK